MRAPERILTWVYWSSPDGIVGHWGDAGADGASDGANVLYVRADIHATALAEVERLRGIVGNVRHALRQWHAAETDTVEMVREIYDTMGDDD